MKCHYVPQSYLNRFKEKSTDIKIACYDRLRAFEPTKRVHPKNTAQLEDYYNLRGFETLVEALSLDTKRIEKEFPILFENGLNAALDRIQSGNQTEEDLKLISRFVAFQLRRTPQTRKKFNEDIQEYDSEKNQTDLDILAQQIRYKVSTHEETKILAMQLENLFLNANWKVIQSEPGSVFITSDNPILLNINPHSNKRDFDNAFNMGIDINKFSKKYFEHLSYAFAASPSHIVVIKPYLDKKSTHRMLRGTWKKDRVGSFNDQVFQYSFFRIYPVTDTLAESYNERFKAGSIGLVDF